MRGEELPVASCQLPVKKGWRCRARFDPARRTRPQNIDNREYFGALPFKWQVVTGNSQVLGFTLIELLVVIGIIALVAGLLVPMLSKSIASAHRTRLQADLQTISQALETYRSDFGDYPRAQAILSNGNLAVTTADRPNPATGAEILCRALIGPAPLTEANAPASTPLPDLKQDGADGPGFRVRGITGRVYGPYLAADKFKIYSFDPTQPGSLVAASDSANFDPLTAFIADIDGSPILYFPARSAKPDITNASKNYAQGYVGMSSNPANSLPKYSQFSLFDADNNWVYLRYLYQEQKASWRSSADQSDTDGNTSSLEYQRICIMLGDYDSSNPTAVTNYDGSIDDPNEVAVSEPFILWCAGQDGKFGPDTNKPSARELSKLDDATNIEK